MTQELQRHFRRMDDYLPFTFRVITRHEFDTLKDMYLAGICGEEPSSPPAITETGLHPEQEAVLRAIEPTLQAFHERLCLLNNKLDAVIALLRGEKPETLYLEKPRKINISGSGCKFETTEPIHEGALVEIKIHLPAVLPNTIPALGKAVHVSRSPNGANIVALHFLAISYKNRETLIQYIFRRERALIRAQKEAGALVESKLPKTGSESSSHK